MGVELAEQFVDVGVFEVVLRLLDLVLVVDIAVRDAAERAVGPDQVEHALDTLQVHREPLEAVGDLAHHGPAVEAAHLLEVRELGDGPRPIAERVWQVRVGIRIDGTKLTQGRFGACCVARSIKPGNSCGSIRHGQGQLIIPPTLLCRCGDFS